MSEITEKKNKLYLPYVVYNNLQKFLEYRKLELVNGSIYIETKKNIKKTDSFVDQEEMIKSIQYYGYILIEAKDKNKDERRFHKSIPLNKDKTVVTYILLLDLESVHIQSSQNLNKVLNKIPGFDDTIIKYNMDIIIISHRDLSIHLLKKIESLISNGDENNGFIHIHPYKYVHFTSEKPVHVFVAPQRILSEEEGKKIIESLFTSKRELSRIKKTDPISIWLGAEIGDIIEALLPSETSGIETKYLIVRP